MKKDNQEVYTQMMDREKNREQKEKKKRKRKKENKEANSYGSF